jgi:hypothetical protein
MLVATTSFGQTSPQTYYVSGNSTATNIFTVPSGVTSITVEVWGAGGGGGDVGGGVGQNGGGGGGYSKITLPVDEGKGYPIFIGSGGTENMDGGYSSFDGSYLIANGGKKATSVSGGSGGNGTTANGSTGGSGNKNSGGNGGDAGNANGTGGAAGGTSGDGADGVNGGGGGGRGKKDGKSSGKGGDGLVVVSWCSTSAGTLSGIQYLCTYNPNKTTSFSSTVSGGTWSSSNTSIATVNPSTGVITSDWNNSGTVTITYKVGGGSSGCPEYSVTRNLYVVKDPGVAAVITGSASQCQNTTANYIASPVSGSYSYYWSYSGSGVVITPAADGLSASFSFNSVATSGNILVKSKNACGTNNGGNEFWVTLGSAPTPTYTSQPGTSTCLNTNVTYATQTGMSGYVWSVPGISETDFTIISGGISASNASVTLKWLTIGSKTVTVNYSQGCAGSVPATNTTSVNANPTITAPATGTTCSGISYLSGPITSTGSTFDWSRSTVAGISNAAGSGTGVVKATGVTETLINTTAGAVNVTYILTPKSTLGCSGSPFNLIVTVNPIVATPTVGTITQPDCIIPTGSVVLTGLPSGNWIINPGGISGSGSSITIDGLTEDTYNFTVTNDLGCTSDATPNIKIKATSIVTNTWSNDSWGNGSWNNGATTTDQKIVFADDYNEDADVNGCSCKVTGGKEVTIKSGKTMKIVNEVEVLASGKLIFENNASLVQINDTAVNEGDIIYNRAVTGIKAKDYVYWSSPVAGQKLANLSSTTKYLWNTALKNWRVPATADMTLGVGYIIRQDVAGDFTGTFEGIPNNGSIPISVGDSGSFNLIGNPYPSAIDADKFLLYNSKNDENDGSKEVLGGTIYFWTHFTPITLRGELETGTAGSGDLAYTSNDYASYNLSGGVSTKAKSDDSSVDEIKYKPSGKIAAGQAFFATSIASGKTAVFKNYMRYKVVGDEEAILDNSQFFKINSNSKTSNTIEKNRVWLNLTNTGGAFKQTLVGYITGATNEFDNVYDGVSFNGNTFIDFYSINMDKNLVIQGRALPFDDNDKVLLGYKTTIVGAFKIAIDEVDGFLVNKKIYLEDKLLDKIQDLSLAPYTFTTETGTFNERFVLSYVDKVTLATNDFEVLENQVVITSKNKEIKINASIDYIDKVFVYDVTGKQIFLKSKIDKNEFIISNMGNTDQVLIVKVLLQNNSVVTKKIIF